MIYDIAPVPKPRMTQADKWHKRACTSAYWDFKAECLAKKVFMPDACKVTFFIAPPKSWSEKKKKGCEYTAHREKPDVDNLLKGLMDAVVEKDKTIWNVHAIKRYSVNPRIEITPIHFDD